MLSGIGRPDDLAALQIPPVAEVLGVGQRRRFRVHVRGTRRPGGAVSPEGRAVHPRGADAGARTRLYARCQRRQTGQPWPGGAGVPGPNG
jgi:hypothetical protein